MPPEIFGNLEKGVIDISREAALVKTEQMLNKIHQNTNIRDQYMLGKYYGIPETAHVDFNGLLKTLR